MSALAAGLAVAVASAPVAGTDPPSSIRLDRVEARLFYEETGRLSDDLLNRPEPFVGWNTIIGEGDAEEAANDMLITVRLEADKFGDKPEKYVDSAVEVAVKNAKGKVLGSRKWPSVLTSGKGVAVLPLWVANVGCAGALTITARYNGTAKSGRLELDCGE